MAGATYRAEFSDQAAQGVLNRAAAMGDPLPLYRDRFIPACAGNTMPRPAW